MEKGKWSGEEKEEKRFDRKATSKVICYLDKELWLNLQYLAALILNESRPIISRGSLEDLNFEDGSSLSSEAKKKKSRSDPTMQSRMAKKRIDGLKSELASQKCKREGGCRESVANGLSWTRSPLDAGNRDLGLFTFAHQHTQSNRHSLSLLSNNQDGYSIPKELRQVVIGWFIHEAEARSGAWLSSWRRCQFPLSHDPLIPRSSCAGSLWLMAFCCSNCIQSFY